jgi:hypothetical protein
MWTWREARKQAVVSGQKWIGATRLRCWAPRLFTGKEVLFHCVLDLQLGAHYEQKGEHICREKSLHEATQQEHVEPHSSSPGQMTSPHASTSTGVPHGMLLRLPVCQDHPSDGVGALNCLQQLKIRPTWATLNGVNWVSGHVLMALILNSGNTCTSLTCLCLIGLLCSLWLLKAIITWQVSI